MTLRTRLAMGMSLTAVVAITTVAVSGTPAHATPACNTTTIVPASEWPGWYAMVPAYSGTGSISCHLSHGYSNEAVRRLQASLNFATARGSAKTAATGRTPRRRSLTPSGRKASGPTATMGRSPVTRSSGRPRASGIRCQLSRPRSYAVARRIRAERSPAPPARGLWPSRS
jgi:hypothetical protein